MPTDRAEYARSRILLDRQQDETAKIERRVKMRADARRAAVEAAERARIAHHQAIAAAARAAEERRKADGMEVAHLARRRDVLSIVFDGRECFLEFGEMQAGGVRGLIFDELSGSWYYPGRLIPFRDVYSNTGHNTRAGRSNPVMPASLGRGLFNDEGGDR